MIINYLKVTIRSLFKNKLFSAINILGLATGMAGALLVFMYVQYELNYDKNFKNYHNIYRIVRDYNIGGEQSLNPSTPYGLAPAIIEEIPSIITATKKFESNTIIKYNNDIFNEYVCYTDSIFFKIFDYEVLSGSLDHFYVNPNQIVISESIAKKYFGDENPIGKDLLFDAIQNFTISAVIKDIPDNSHFKYEIIAPISKFNNGIPDDEWYNNYFITYVLLNEKTSLSETNEQLTDLYIRKMSDDDRKNKLALQNLQEQHFDRSQLSKLNIYLFIAVGVFILILACINYMNLSTAKYIKRTKEVGIRKILGANRSNLISQFFGETILLSIVSVFFGILLVESILPYFNQITEMNNNIDYLSLDFLLITASIILFSSLLAGSYPALFLSSFKPVKILKGQLGRFKLSSKLRTSLVILQFTITTILVISMGFIFAQFHYMTNKNVGFTTENIIYLNLTSKLTKNYDVFKSTLLTNPNIKSVTKTSFLPMNIYGLINDLSWDEMNNQEKTAFAFQSVEHDFLNTIDYKLVEGRFFSEEFASDSSAVIINKKAQRLMGYETPIGKRILFGDEETDDYVEIIGVVEDFHTQPVNNEIEPIMLLCEYDFFNYVLIKLDGINNTKSIDFISEQWTEFSPGFPFKYRYMDDKIKSMYGDTHKTAKAFTLFVIIALLISCAGLFGLSSFTVEQKTKEIGIRKALGASTQLVYLLLNKAFTKWVLISILIGMPIAYFLMNKWLNNFAYHIKPNFLILLGAGLLILLIAQFTVAFQTIKSARSNPVNSLRYE